MNERNTSFGIDPHAMIVGAAMFQADVHGVSDGF
ncbi:hypothetical protein ACVWY2_002879 [Bradyrhizobium sp. JR6.1]